MNRCNCIGVGWKNAPIAISVIFEPSSIPNQSNNSGIQARLGIDLIAEKLVLNMLLPLYLIQPKSQKLNLNHSYNKAE